MFGATTLPPKPPLKAPGKYAPEGYRPPLPPGAEGTTPESKTMLYVGLGLGALVLIGGAVLLMKD